MNFESITTSDVTWLDFLSAAVILIGLLSVFLTVTSGHSKKLVILGPVLIAVFAGSVITAAAVEKDTRAASRATISSHFEKSYGLKLDEDDFTYLRNVDKAEVTRDLETADGGLKHVLFRLVDDEVLPHALDSEGSWIPMPAAGGQR